VAVYVVSSAIGGIITGKNSLRCRWYGNTSIHCTYESVLAARHLVTGTTHTWCHSGQILGSRLHLQIVILLKSMVNHRVVRLKMHHHNKKIWLVKERRGLNREFTGVISQYGQYQTF
jgi:hypothetical protein